MNEGYSKLTYNGQTICGENGRISEFKVITKNPRTFSLLEFEMQILDIPSGFNVYDEKDVLISVETVFNSGKTIKTRAFYFEEYEFNQSNELVGRTKKNPCFRIRISPQEEGECRVTVKLYISNKQVDCVKGCVLVGENKKGSQILRVEPNRRHTFIKKSGENLILFGENVGWNFPIQQHHCFGQYIINHMTSLSKCGGNLVRIWDYLEAGSRIRKTIHTMCQHASAMWDRIFETAENMGVYVSLVMTVHGEVSSRVDSSFALSVWNRENGGFITDPKEFFTDRKVIDAYKMYIQYIVARWGYCENIIWELFNEIDHTDAMIAGNLNEVRSWLQEMSDYMRKNDPYGHFVTNSTGGVGVTSALWEAFDFVYYHQYNAYSVAQVADMHREAARAYNRPVIIGEFGYDGPFSYYFNEDSHISKDLLIVHLGNWAGVMGGGAGTAMNWWWMDMPAVDGYQSYIGISKMSKRIPWEKPSIRTVTNETIATSHNRINVMGYCDNESAYLWFCDNNYLPTCRDEFCFQDETALLPLSEGKYSVKWIDTRSGESFKEDKLKVSGDKAAIKMPKWSVDIAVVVEKE